MDGAGVTQGSGIIKDAQFLRDNYIKLGKLGSGGFGTVWKGFRLTDSLPVAIKEIAKSKVTQWGKWEGQRIPMEAVFLMRLKRVEGVIRIMDICVDQDKYVIIMERPKQSIDLFDYITERHRLSDQEARHIFRHVFKILERCRRRNVFHGDVKDENILINVDTKKVRLIDFGGAMEWSENPYSAFLGTGLWSPPECNKRQAFYAEGATVWSLGCLLHTLLIGDIPFKTKGKAVEAEFSVNAASISDKRALDLITRCLEIDVEKRLTLDQVSSHPWFKAQPSKKRKILCPVTTEQWLSARMQGDTHHDEAGNKAERDARARDGEPNRNRQTEPTMERDEEQEETPDGGGRKVKKRECGDGV